MNEVKLKITMASKDEIELELYPEIAPVSVENFLSLVDEGFYNGLGFHRVIPGFMVQGGCPKGNGTGDASKRIKGEFAANGVKNNLKHTRGVLSMARAMDPNSASCQFFLMTDDAPHLDGNYAAFGCVTKGMEYVDAIVMSPRDRMDKPLQPIIMEKIERI